MLPSGLLTEVLSHWGYSDVKVCAVKDVFHLQTPDGPRCLKGVGSRGARLAFVYAATEHIAQSGFIRLNRFIPTGDGLPFLHLDGVNYFMARWVPGRQCDFSLLPELCAATRALAECHAASVGFLPADAGTRVSEGRWADTFARRVSELEEFKGYAACDSSRFSRRLRADIDRCVGLARHALSVLKASDYARLHERTLTRGFICHGDVAARNFIMGCDGLVYIIDFDACRQDIRVTDLQKHLRRALRRRGWDFATAKLILEAYQSTCPLDDEEWPVLFAFLLFPHKLWRLAARFYYATQDWPMAWFTERLEALSADLPAVSRLLREMEPICLGRAR